jgi:threonine dehydratase
MATANVHMPKQLQQVHCQRTLRFGAKLNLFGRQRLG